MVSDYDHPRMARRILQAAGKYDADGSLVGVAVGTTATHVEVDPATMERLLDSHDRLASLLAEMRMFTTHAFYCAAYERPAPSPCDCGLADLLADIPRGEP